MLVKEVSAQKNSFPKCDFVKVMAHQLDGNERHSFAQSALTNQIGDSVELNQSQAIEFLELINDSTSYGNIVAACHYPMMGLIFYDEENEVCAQASICMGCNNIYTDPKLNLALGYDRSGFSNDTRKELRRQFKDWGYPDYGFQVMFDNAEQYRIHLNNRGLSLEEIEKLVQEEFGEPTPQNR